VSVDENSYDVYKKIYPFRPDWIIWTFTFFVGFFLLLSWWLRYKYDWELYAAAVLMSITCLRYSVHFIKRIISYKKFKYFYEHLDFNVDGWKLLFRNPDILKAQHWAIDCYIEIIPVQSISAENKKYLNDALFLFTINAQNRFYKSFLFNGRKEWKTEHDLKATGSIDVAVIGDIYVFLNDYLKNIQHKYKIIDTVKIHVDDRIQFIKFNKGAY
jgi:hypothetical protein